MKKGLSYKTDVETINEGKWRDEMVTFGLFDAVFPIVFFLMFVVVIGTFVFIFARSISEWNHNNQSPKLRVNATVVTKREDIRHMDSDDTISSSTSYFITFQVESGDRIEFHVSGQQYGMLAQIGRAHV